MKFLRLLSDPLRGTITSSFAPKEFAISGDPLAMLPGELWRKIIGFTVRLAGASAVDIDLEDPFAFPHINEGCPELDPGLSADRKSLSLVNSTWRAAVREISAEYLIIYSGDQLASLVRVFEVDKFGSSSCNQRLGFAKILERLVTGNRAGCPIHLSKHLGEWTTRIDFRIIGSYSVPHVLRLLQCVPNLQFYLNGNKCKSSGQSHILERSTPTEIIRGLAIYNAQSLRRVEWTGTGESPRYADLLFLCNSIPHLVTLRLVTINSYPTEQRSMCTLPTLPELKNLSLGNIPTTANHDGRFVMAWSPLLNLFCQSPRAQLPSLKRLDCIAFSTSAMQFFNVHGHKIRIFSTTDCSAEGVFLEALKNCPNLEALVISQVSGQRMSFPQDHQALRRLCIYPCISVAVGAPSRMLNSVFMGPLDELLRSIEKMTAQHLVELRISGEIDMYENLHESSTWLQLWWLRWNIRGVDFRDKTGEPYLGISSSSYEMLLNLVRS